MLRYFFLLSLLFSPYIVNAVDELLCARISHDVYQEETQIDTTEAEVIFASDWMLGYTGYRARAYYVKATNEVIVGHRGSCAIQDFIVNDPEVFFHHTPDSAHTGKAFMQRLQENLQNRNIKPISITHTGHSLGGLVGIFLAFYDNSKAICFDCPGSKEILLNAGFTEEDINRKKDDIKEYLGVYNIVNSAGTHVGHIYKPNQVRKWRVKTEPGFLQWMPNDGLMFFLGRTVEVHQMVGMVDELAEQAKTGVNLFDEVYDWPKDASEALLCYFLNYEKNSGFWDRVFRDLQVLDKEKYSNTQKKMYIYVWLTREKGETCKFPKKRDLIADLFVKNVDGAIGMFGSEIEKRLHLGQAMNMIGHLLYTGNFQ